MVPAQSMEQVKSARDVIAPWRQRVCSALGSVSLLYLPSNGQRSVAVRSNPPAHQPAFPPRGSEDVLLPPGHRFCWTFGLPLYTPPPLLAANPILGSHSCPPSDSLGPHALHLPRWDFRLPPGAEQLLPFPPPHSKTARTLDPGSPGREVTWDSVRVTWEWYWTTRTSTSHFSLKCPVRWKWSNSHDSFRKKADRKYFEQKQI